MRGVILYGPPGVGKDTITVELHGLEPRYELFRRLKMGGGRTVGYRMTDRATLEALRAANDVVWENARYESLYIIDRRALIERLRASVPVVHLGQPEAISAIISCIPEATWFVVALTCPRDVAKERIAARETGDYELRMRAWDATEPLESADLVIDTGLVCPSAAARLIASRSVAEI